MGSVGFIYWLTAHGLAPRTISDTVKRIDYLKRHHALTKKGFERFLVSHRQYTNNTLNVYLKAIKNYGKYTRSRPLLSFKLLPKNGSPRSSFSLDELSRFLSITVPHSNRSKCNYDLFFKLLGLCGMRPNELAKLRNNDVSFAEGCMYLVDTKTHDSRKVPIPPSLISQMGEYCNGKDRLFPTCGQQWGRAFHYRLKLAGIKRANLTTYSLRHTVITLLLQTPNVNLFDVQSLVGHKNASTTQIYVHTCLERIKKVVQSHPLLSSNLTPLERARIIADTIRTFGIDLNPTINTLKNHSIEIKLNIPPPKSGKPHATA